MSNIAKEINDSIAKTTKGAGMPELYPVDNEVKKETIDNVQATVYKELRYQGEPLMAKVDGVPTPLAIKGIATDLGPITGKYMVLEADEDRPWSINGKSGTVKKGDTKPFIVV